MKLTDRPIHFSAFVWLFLLGSSFAVCAAAQAQTMPASAGPVDFTTVPKGDVLTKNADGSVTVTTPIGNVYRYYIDANKGLQVQMLKFVGLESLVTAPADADPAGAPEPAGYGPEQFLGPTRIRQVKTLGLPASSGKATQRVWIAQVYGAYVSLNAGATWSVDASGVVHIQSPPGSFFGETVNYTIESKNDGTTVSTQTVSNASGTESTTTTTTTTAAGDERTETHGSNAAGGTGAAPPLAVDPDLQKDIDAFMRSLEDDEWRQSLRPEIQNFMKSERVTIDDVRRVSEILCAPDPSDASVVCAVDAASPGRHVANFVLWLPLDGVIRAGTITIRKSSGAYSLPALIGRSGIAVPGVPLESRETVRFDFSSIVGRDGNVPAPNAAPKPAEHLRVEIHGQTVTIDPQGANSARSVRPVLFVVDQPSDTAASGSKWISLDDLVYINRRNFKGQRIPPIVYLGGDGGRGTMGSGSGGVWQVGGALHIPLGHLFVGPEGGFEHRNATTVQSVGTRTPPSGGTSTFATTTVGLASPYLGALVSVTEGRLHVTIDAGALFPKVTQATTSGVCVSGNATRPGTCTDGTPTSSSVRETRPYVGLGVTFPIASRIDLGVGYRAESLGRPNGRPLGIDNVFTAGISFRLLRLSSRLRFR